MPGTYAHLTLVNELRGSKRIYAIPGLTDEAADAVLQYLKYCELGAVSPDYPYLALLTSGAKVWADAMHYERTGDVIRVGTRLLQDLKGAARAKGLAWLLGYTAHVVADVTVHPVVALRVGPYEGHETEHRICEMHQDAYIFPKRMNLDLSLSEYLDSGIRTCGSSRDLDADVEGLWRAILREVYPEKHAEDPPRVDQWHSAFGVIVDKITALGGQMLPLSRHLMGDHGLTYPTAADVDPSYVAGLQVPTGTETYDSVFDRAIENTSRVWASVAAGLTSGTTPALADVRNWNLDTGRDESNTLTFWG